jgi:formylglycine-generating enzyme required for sulfatase activity
MHKLLSLFLLLTSLVSVLPAYAAKERLVLMPLRVSDEDKALRGAMETAVVEGLQQKYVVFSGEQVSKKAREIFNRESRSSTTSECDETRCMQGIAEAFQAELIATTNVTRRDGGYFLALSIQNIFDNKVVYSKSLPCKDCDAFQVVESLKELSGAPLQVVEAPPAVSAATGNDADTALWVEVQKGNHVDEYNVYLAQFPRGKYVALARSRIQKLNEQQAATQMQQEQAAWNEANSIASVDSYLNYLDVYPKGKFAALAQTRLGKLKKQDSNTTSSRAGPAGKSCASCPEMVAIPAGKFEMGSGGANNEQSGGLINLTAFNFHLGANKSNDQPRHTVTLKAFRLGKAEVTQSQWQAVMGNNPGKFSGCGDCPVEQVNWDEVQQYIQKLNAQTGLRFRLPSEAEWEYACRAGTQYSYCGGDNPDSVGWYSVISGEKTAVSAQKQANAFGLHDMSGNVWEWVQDCWNENYIGAPGRGEPWQSGDCDKHVLRGGSWSDGQTAMRAEYRSWNYSNTRDRTFGFRLAQD